MKRSSSVLRIVHCGLWFAFLPLAQAISLQLDLGQPGKPISPDLIGIFFEDINYAADGGLYAELVQNRSFEYSPADNQDWTSLTAWELVQREGGRGVLVVDEAQPLNGNNPRYATLGVGDGGLVGIRNDGFDGIPVKADETYDFSLFARQLAHAGGPLTVRLENQSGAVLAEAKLPVLTGAWKKYTAVLQPNQTDSDARLVVFAAHPGRIGLDMISLFPRRTFKNRPNGLRADIAQVIADLKPRFMRFPGGCIVHGDGIDNIYHWKKTIGPVETRKSQRNSWKYHQSMGLGYFEYFQFCEDIGAMPVPIVAAGVCCQGSSRVGGQKWGDGQQGIALEDMPTYVQDVLDLIEYANGPVTSTWGAKRAAAGHPAPFSLKYLGVGNEDKITPEFTERFRLIHDALKAKHPEIIVIGTAGFKPDGDDFNKGWRFARELQLPVMDEHYYKPPQWFWDNLKRYDNYERTESKIYVGEYAAHDEKRHRTVRAAIAEAAFLANLERNGDAVIMASYAPLLAKRDRTQWDPDLIYFDNTDVFLTPSYHVQQLFSLHAGDTYLNSVVAEAPKEFTASVVRDSRSGDLILKLVNGATASESVTITLNGVGNLKHQARVTTFGAPDASATMDYDNASQLRPQTSTITTDKTFTTALPANSLTVVRIPAR